MTELQRHTKSGRRAGFMLAISLLVGLGTGCDGLLKNNEVPPGTTDPALTKTPQGALAIYYGALGQLQQSMGTAFGRPYVTTVGYLTDELQTGSDMGSNVDFEDLRNMTPENPGSGTSQAYGGFQRIRGQTGQAIQLLSAYSPEKRALIGHAYAVQGYAEVLLAELFCSGIPLSTLDFNGDYTPKAGSTTEQVFNHAIALFDTALTFAGDSARFFQLATVGKARAQLGLGRFADASTTVAQVPDDYRYQIAYSSATTTTGVNPQNFAFIQSFPWTYSVADQEGGNGLNYRTSNDPRTAATFEGTNRAGFSVYTADKYAADGTTPIILASGVEARLIEAEGALQAGDVGAWLTKLNALRTGGGPVTMTVPDTLVDTLGYTGCTSLGACDNDGFASSIDYSGLVLVTSSTVSLPEGPEVQACRDNGPNRNYSCLDPPVNVYADPAHTHTVTVVPTGIGGVAGLDALSDPGTPDGRVDLMFRERAFWLFLTGHRQGDLRRLIHYYGRTQDQVYPVGPYPGGPLLIYGHDVTAPVPANEQQYNPQYTGCFSRAA